MSFSKVVRLTRDAETQVTANQKELLKMSAVYDVGFGQNKLPVFCNMVKWGSNNQGLLPYLKKGQQISVLCDDVFPETYVSTKDGTTKVNLKCNVLRIELVGSSQQQQQQQHQPSQPTMQQQRQQQQPVQNYQQPMQQQAPGFQPEFDDDIPF